MPDSQQRRPATSPRTGDSFDPAEYHQPHDIAGLLGPGWQLLADETRPRTTPAPAGTHHTHDTVLRARRPP